MTLLSPKPPLSYSKYNTPLYYEYTGVILGRDKVSQSPHLLTVLIYKLFKVMNLSEIKSSLNKETLNLNYVITEAGEKTSWLKDWDNENRIAVLVHADTFAKIKADNTLTTLGINRQVKQGAKGEYTALTICLYTPADETL